MQQLSVPPFVTPRAHPVLSAGNKSLRQPRNVQETRFFSPASRAALCCASMWRTAHARGCPRSRCGPCRAKGRKRNDRQRPPKDRSKSPQEVKQGWLSAIADEVVEDDPFPEPPAGNPAGDGDFGGFDRDGVAVVKRGGGKRAKAEPRPLPGSLYDNPKYLDWAGSYREFEAEVDFLHDVFEEETSRAPASYLDLGCGPAQHAMEMAESELTTYCLDTSDSMLKYAAGLAEEDDLSMQFLQQDMRQVELPDGAQVDLAACLNGTLQHLHTHADVLRMLLTTRAALTDTGLLVLEVNHPALLFDGSIVSTGSSWEVEFPEAQVEVLWGTEEDSFDALTQVLTRHVEVHAMHRDGDLTLVRDVLQLRQFTFTELQLLVTLAGFSIRRVYGDFERESRIVELGDAPADGQVDGQKAQQGPGESYKPPPSAPSTGEEEDEPFRIIMFCAKCGSKPNVPDSLVEPAPVR